MAKHNLLKSRKAQFFIISAFTIVTILYFISRWMEPYTIIDTSSIAGMEEPFIFNNIKEKAEYAINGSKNCEELKYNLEEYKFFSENYVLGKGYNFDLNYTIANCPEEVVPAPPPSPTVVAFKLTLASPTVFLLSEFSCGWPTGCPV